jgi:hypothetical protein
MSVSGVDSADSFDRPIDLEQEFLGYPGTTGAIPLNRCFEFLARAPDETRCESGITYEELTRGLPTLRPYSCCHDSTGLYCLESASAGI